MAWKVTTDPLEFEEAVAWFRQKITVSGEVFRALNDKARRRAFTVAGVAQADLLADVFTSLEAALRSGTPYEEWARLIGPRLEQAWGGPKAFRTELIFRQNILGSYAAGRFAQATDPDVIKARPYWMFDAVLDSGTTATCRALNNTVLPYDHPFWQRNYPPRHFGCRSGIRSLTEQEALQRGITKTAPTAESPEGFGRLPDLDEWGNDMAVGAVTSARSGNWSPAGVWKSAADYDRPATVPVVPMPVPLLPTIAEDGREAFEAALVAAWGGPVVALQDPTGAGVVLSKDYLLRHLADDNRERFFGLLPDVLERPYEVWLQPQQSDTSGRVVLRKVYIKLYAQDKKNRPIAVVVEQHRGAVWDVYTAVVTQERQILKRRRGFLLWGAD